MENKNEVVRLAERVNKFSQIKNNLHKLEQMETNLMVFKNHYTKSFNSFKGQLSKLGQRITDIGYAPFSSDSGNGLTMESLNEQDLRKFSYLEEGIKELKDNVIDLQNSLRSEGTETDVEKLNARIKEIESRVSGESVAINHGQFVFTSEMEVGIWLEKEENTITGIFCDIFSAMVAMAPKCLSGKERADQQYSSDRIQSTTAENELTALMA